jgi:ABC-2 type transport system ATP-binding protein
VTQAPSVYADLSIAENLRYFAAILGVGPQRIGEVVSTVGLAGREQQVVGSLSGGERSRVSLATALLSDPELLVLDEPTVGLDPVLRAELWGTFRELAQAGSTLLISSHVMDEANECDQLLLMRDGALLVAPMSSEARKLRGSVLLGVVRNGVLGGQRLSRSSVDGRLLLVGCSIPLLLDRTGSRVRFTARLLWLS